MDINCAHETSKLNQLRIDLARNLGFQTYPDDKLADPYLNYIENRYTGEGSLDEYLSLFIHVIQHFQDVQTNQSPATAQNALALKQNTIQAFIDTLCASNSEPLFSNTTEDSPLRRELVTDTVLYILGVWVAMLSYFVRIPGGYRQIELAYCLKHGKRINSGYEVALTESLPGLLMGSGVLPSLDGGPPILRGTFSGFDETVQALLSSMRSARSTDSASSSTGPAQQLLEAALASYVSLSSLDQGPNYAASLSYPTSSLLHTSIDSLESLTIKAKTLNAYTLSLLGGVHIYWTLNLSRHLILSKVSGRDVLEVFALPCILRCGATSLKAAGVPPGLIHEIQESYSILFYSGGSPSIHSRVGKIFGLKCWCWCQSCSSQRLRSREIKALRRKTFLASKKRSRNSAKSEFDPLLEELMVSPDPEDWSYELFPHLWSRIIALEEHLVSAKPWNFWVLFLDRRDTLQFWTFFLGTVILTLTVAQVALGAAQVAGAFK